MREHAPQETGSHPLCQLGARYADTFHLFRFICGTKGLRREKVGHMAHKPGAQAPLRSCDATVIRLASGKRVGTGSATAASFLASGPERLRDEGGGL
ncbi:hypothetical protein GCM10010512_51560 [Streptomyces thermoviolaceus subsp. thermoviolaceus]|nr:hypothetical protein GCM10010512_51560 [Streptomyces thermoviolaceus subsp. thermoviolaceus]